MPGADRPTTSDEAPRLTFGLYPGMTGEELTNTGPIPDDPGRTVEALERLRPGGRPFLIRSYVIYHGGGRTSNQTPIDPARYARDGRRLDFVICYRSADGDLADWAHFVRETVGRYGPHLDALQVAEEPNNPDAGTGGDGGSPNVRRAVVEGVLAAKDEARRRGFDVRVGFNATPSFHPDDTFWPELAALGGAGFVEALDYVGLDFFPDVFRPVPPGDLRAAVEGVLTHFRRVNLATGGIPATVPIRVTENGWPTGPGRSPERQAEVLETVIRAAHDLRGPLNITHFEFFLLRDSDSDRPEMGYQFGLLRHDYRPKPAFETYRRLIAELGGDA